MGYLLKLIAISFITMRWIIFVSIIKKKLVMTFRVIKLSHRLFNLSISFQYLETLFSLLFQLLKEVQQCDTKVRFFADVRHTIRQVFYIIACKSLLTNSFKTFRSLFQINLKFSGNEAWFKIKIPVKFANFGIMLYLCSLLEWSFNCLGHCKNLSLNNDFF